MGDKMNQNYYLRRESEAKKQLSKYEDQSLKLSIFRLVSFTIFLIGFILYLFDIKFMLIISLISFGIFISLIIFHDKILKKIKYFRFLIHTLNEYIFRFDDRWMSIGETGNEFINNEQPFLKDLDIIGEASLFKYLNICKSNNGKQKLIHRLSNPLIKKEELIARQQSMQEISNNIDFSLDFQVALKIYQDEGANLNLSYIIKHLNTKIEFSKVNVYLSFVFSILSLSLLVLAILGRISWIFFTITFLFQLLDSMIHQKKYKDVFVDINNIAFTIAMLESVYKVINKEKFSDETLNKLQSDIKNYGLGGISEINKIRAIESFNHYFLTYLFFNGLFSINILIIYYFKKFIDKYGVNYSKSIEALEEFEVYTSLAILGQTKKDITLPKLSDEISINFTNLKHPLIQEEQCVSNSFNQENNINIITGSNMSGKTSFLRMIGINIILMNAGAYCNAESFSCPYLKLFTSMRIADDITKGISTFYAELIRIRAAIDYSKQNKPMIIFIDEIFKGTNSNDRIKGAISLIEKLNKRNVIIFISTHDFELCEIKSVNISNYHFSEYYEEDKIKFDYKLKKGRCKTTNAVYLMKLAGII